MSDNTKYATIPGFEQLTAQQVFDMSASHLLKQMEQSRDPRIRQNAPNGLCLYRNDAGLKCAAGVFLTEERAKECDLYDNCGTGSGWKVLVEVGLVPKPNCDLIDRLQKLHDNNWPSDWREKLITLAAECGLNDSVCR